MQIKLTNTAEQNELIRAMGSNNPVTSRQAAEAVAAFVTDVIKKVLMTAGTASAIYTDLEFDEDSDPSIPVDLFNGEGEGLVSIWSQSMHGGLPTNRIEGGKEIKFSTYRIDSAVSFGKKYARKSRMDVVSKALERMANEVLIKQERNAWAVILMALAQASTRTVNGGTLAHVVDAAVDDVFGLGDLNSLMTRIKRLNESYSGNTPTTTYTNGITDLYVSPEIKGQIRAFAYNPINTTASAAAGAQAKRDQMISDNMRDEIYRTAGMQSIYGVNIVEMIELGTSQKYNKLFHTFMNANANATVTGFWTTTGDSTSEILVGIDNTRKAFLRPVARQAESNGTFTVTPDTQWEGFGIRADKVGFYGFLEEGRMCLDARSVAGIIV
jgi:hypothetical protein